MTIDTMVNLGALLAPSVDFTVVRWHIPQPVGCVVVAIAMPGVELGRSREHLANGHLPVSQRAVLFIPLTAHQARLPEQALHTGGVAAGPEGQHRR